ncbi:DUF2627 family protein [Oceanobacillus salinisoli]|uniref:DUF2627 family protein n=1 Tax=Oceanobacillus salinisoli TaxID=2678611 RepID=UPI0012E30B64|nr:DUF2627 family protein [Oceanobacillus salinisoli]
MRMIALLLLLIPGLIAVFGIKLMRDSMFSDYYYILLNTGVQFFVGLVLFILGFFFIGGFIVYRDRKNKYRAIPDKEDQYTKTNEE